MELSPEEKEAYDLFQEQNSLDAIAQSTMLTVTEVQGSFTEEPD
jgi:hypothetical protein